MDTKLKCEIFSKYISTNTSYFLVKEQVFVSKTERVSIVAARPHYQS